MDLNVLGPLRSTVPLAAKEHSQPAGSKLRIVLMCPRGPLYRHRGGIWKKTMRYAPLTLTTLASLIPPEIPVELTLLDEGVDEIDAATISADLVGITVITGTAPRAYELAREFRARNIAVVLGGVHPTLMPEEAATPKNHGRSC
jgi:B12 binding protein